MLSNLLAQNIFLIFAGVCFCCYLSGVVFIVHNRNVAKNECQMTFMFEHPNYVKINFPENEKYPKYNLYHYSEGHLTENARNMIFNGAPVLFIPGNRGSFKQSRSLASVALRKGIDNDWFHHLDYFTVDLNEEYSAVFGGVLEEQSSFIEHSITTILKVYKRLSYPPKKIIIVAHSIGGKLAQKLLTNPKTAEMVGAVITLASPMDKPVVSWDVHIKEFYKTIDAYWSENRTIEKPKNNSCGLKVRKANEQNSSNKILDDILLITIGGGNKDLLVHSGLTNSKFSDLHVMSSEMSNVWIESDHLCIVWCLQIVLVVNRFLYSIIAPATYKGDKSKGLSFLDKKSLMLAKAEQHFLGLKPQKDMKTRKMESPTAAEWYEDNRRIFTEKFKNGLNKTRIQMIRLVENPLYDTLIVDATNVDTDEWLFGCDAIETTKESRFCSQGSPISRNYITRLPPDFPDRILLKLNLRRIKERHPKWTHVLLRFEPSREPFQYTIDIHNPYDRQIKVTMPKWYSFGSLKLLDDTLLGASFYQFNITGMDETHQALELVATPKYCSKQQTVARACIPWTEGFCRYHQFVSDPSFIISTPKSRPLNYNTTDNPVIVEIHLDSTCRYSFEIRQSFMHTMARIVLQFTHWLPAQLVAIMCLAIKHQITLTPLGEKFKCGSLRKALAKCTPFFIITVSRIFLKVILMFKMLPRPETLPTSLVVSVLIHGASLALAYLVTVGVWTGITFSGSMAHKLLFRLVHMPIPMISDTIVSIIEKFPASVAVLLISLAFGSCGGIALIVACIIYFILLSKMYEEYLENFVFKTARLIAMKLFGRVRKPLQDELVEQPHDKEDSGETDKKPEEELTNNENGSGDDVEVDRMMAEAMAKQKEEKKRLQQEEAAARAEYDSITTGFDGINFHLPLFLLLVLLSILSVPSVVTWAKNYHYAKILTPDPMLASATCVLVSLGFIWQMNTPRNIYYYKALGNLLYVCAAVSILYCQDGMYRLNYIIAFIFAMIAIHQFLAPRKSDAEDRQDKQDYIDKMKSGYDKLKMFRGFVME